MTPECGAVVDLEDQRCLMHGRERAEQIAHGGRPGSRHRQRGEILLTRQIADMQYTMIVAVDRLRRVAEVRRPDPSGPRPVDDPQPRAIAMATLPEEQRIVITLVQIEGFTYREAAEILGIPEGTVTSRLVRARAAIEAQVLGEDGT